MKEFISKYRDVIVTIIFFSVIGIFGYKYKMEKNQISKDPRFVTGIISSTNPASKGGIDIDYVYYVDRIKYECADICFAVNGRHAKEFINRPVMVVYSASHPKYNKLLLLPEEYEKFGVRMPPGTSWIYEYIR